MNGMYTPPYVRNGLEIIKMKTYGCSLSNVAANSHSTTTVQLDTKEGQNRIWAVSNTGWGNVGNISIDDTTDIMTVQLVNPAAQAHALSAQILVIEYNE